MGNKKSHHAVDEIREFVAKKRYAERRNWIDGVKVLAGCADCGVNSPAEILTFDHVRGDKKFNIGQSWNQGKAALVAEMEKCDIVCSNCHAIRTKHRGKTNRAGFPEFVPFPKIPRLSRDMVITEKIDGTNSTVWVDGDGDVWAASKNKWITPYDDNYGFARWVEEHREDFSNFGANVFTGEWWGDGIQRGYGLKEKRFSLFNVSRWSDPDIRPSCCHVVPTLYTGVFDSETIDRCLDDLATYGSYAAPGYMKPEGIVVFHSAGGYLFKKTIEKDEFHKGEIAT